ncbi:MAG: hypothetical protein KGL39_25265 [Patescibacteria group bacterium]|nr:hypothetical protein [Patescibacteria group bacterium]
MRRLWTEWRVYLSEVLLGWALRIVPADTPEAADHALMARWYTNRRCVERLYAESAREPVEPRSASLTGEAMPDGGQRWWNSEGRFAENRPHSGEGHRTLTGE